MKRILVIVLLLVSVLAFSQDKKLFIKSFPVSHTASGAATSTIIKLTDFQRAADHWQILLELDTVQTRTDSYADTSSAKLLYRVAGGRTITSTALMVWSKINADTLATSTGVDTLLAYTNPKANYMWLLDRSTSQTLPTDLDITHLGISYIYGDSVSHVIRRCSFSARNTLFGVKP